ncbi:MAG: hypothetical protein K0Q70_1037 [Rhodospirillales bacterium]|jgi:hypothetical protein|nr:hypothetical protein [Rhodospirillales bacterium]
MRLIDRQRALIDHLVAPAEYRGREDGHGLSEDLIAIGPSRLRIVGEQALAKRMSKVRDVFPQTCRAMSGDFARLASEFANACAPTSIDRWDNARQFRDYLVELWRNAAPDPEYLSDLLAFEESLWLARSRLNERLVTASDDDTQGTRRYVRADGIALLSLNHDIRGLTSPGSTQAVAKRPVHLVVRQARIGQPVKVFEIPEAAFALLRRFDQVASYSRDEISAWDGMSNGDILRDLLQIGAVMRVS